MNPLKSAYNRFSDHLDARFERLPLEDRLAFVMVEETIGRASAPRTPTEVKRKSLPSPAAMVEPATDYFLPNSLRWAHDPKRDETVTYASKHPTWSKLTHGCRRLVRACAPAPAREAAPQGRITSHERPKSWAYWRKPPPPPAPPKMFSLFF